MQIDLDTVASQYGITRRPSMAKSERCQLLGTADDDSLLWKFSSEWLDTSLRYSRPSYPRVRMAKAGQLLNQHEYITVSSPIFENDYSSVDRRLDSDLALKQLASGASIVWDWIEEISPDLRSASVSLAAAIGCQVLTSAYVSDGIVGAFNAHADSMDIAVAQTVGEKSWKVAHKDGATETFLLGAGDVLWLPRGTNHLVSPTNRRSIHLSISMIPPSLRMFTDWLSKRLDDEITGDDLRSGIVHDTIDGLVGEFLSEFPHAQPFYLWR